MVSGVCVFVCVSCHLITLGSVRGCFGVTVCTSERVGRVTLLDFLSAQIGYCGDLSVDPVGLEDGWGGGK